MNDTRNNVKIVLKFRRIKIGTEEYALSSADRIYDLELVNNGHLYLIGNLDRSGNKMKFIRLHDNPTIIKRLQILTGKKLDDINLNKRDKIIEEEELLKREEEYWAPDGAGYLTTKEHFEELQKPDKSGGSRSRRRKRSRRQKARRKKSRRNRFLSRNKN